MSDPFYVTPGPDLSQGDIVDHVPWGLIDAPTTLCRPDDRKKSSGKAFYGSVAEIKRPRPLPWTLDPEFVHGVSWEGLAIVLWHGCQIDKWKHRDLQTGKDRSDRAFAAIAPMISADSLQPPDAVGSHGWPTLFVLSATSVQGWRTRCAKQLRRPAAYLVATTVRTCGPADLNE